MDHGSVHRAVTPSMDSGSTGGGGIVRGKMLSYQANGMRRVSAATSVSGSSVGGGSISGFSAVGTSSNVGRMGTGTGPMHQSGVAPTSQSKQSGYNPQRAGGDMNILGRSAIGTAGIGGVIGGSKPIGVLGSSTSGLPAVPGSAARHQTSTDSQFEHGSMQSLASLPRYDLFPLSDEIPSDGIIFAKVRNQADSLVVFRTPEERLRNPERLNLDRRQLDVCPLLEQEQRLRLLNFQNNSIRVIQNLENLPNLIFLDLYNNKLVSLEGPLGAVKGLRVLMAGKNRIAAITNLTHLRKLDVLDLHSNEIRQIEGLDGLTDLRVLNLAGNRISSVQRLASLQALTELNLRRNNIERVYELDQLPALQRIFLSHNLIVSFNDVQCLLGVRLLIELSLDGNPLSESDPVAYRNKIIGGMASLRHLDLKRITDAERTQAVLSYSSVKDEDNGLLGQSRPAIASSMSTNSNANASSSSKEESSTNAASQQGGDKAVGGAEINTAAISKPSTAAAEAVPAPNGQAVEAATAVAASNSGLAALARVGRISNNRSMFDLELIAPNEKALIAVGEAWEWVQTKRLLVNVTEASLLHMKVEHVVAKFSPNISCLPALKTFRLVNNEIEALKDVGSVIESLGRASVGLERLFISENPINANASLLRHYINSLLPNLKSFNDSIISDTERAESVKIFKPVLRLNELASSLNVIPFPVAPSSSIADSRVKLQSSKRPGASMGTRSSFTENYSVDALVSELSESTIQAKSSKTHFEDALSRVVLGIFRESVFSVSR